jgi:hypothetical protein
VKCLGWEATRDDWVDDGAFVIASNTDLAEDDWQRLLDAFHSSSWPLELHFVEGPVPSKASELFRLAGEGTHRLVVSPSEEVDVDCYAYWTLDTETPHPTTIECNFAKAQIRGQRQLDAFCAFVQTLGSSIRKPVLIADEMAPERPWMRYDPDTYEFWRVDYESKRRRGFIILAVAAIVIVLLALLLIVR